MKSLPRITDRSVTFELPQVGDKVTLGFFRYPVSLIEVADYIKGGTSVTYSIKHGDSEADPGTDVIAARVADSTERNATTELSLYAIPRQQVVWIEVTGVVGSVEKIFISLGYKP